MTLILTALCKDGICVCADKMCKKTYPNKKPKFEEIEKIYVCDAIPFSLFIYNHGINEFCGKTWKMFCDDYEKSDRWKDKNLEAIIDDFMKFIEKDVQTELNRQPTKMTAFILSGEDLNTKHPYKYKCHELVWPKKYLSGQWNEPSFIGSGLGYEKCLMEHVNNHKQISQPKYWSSLVTNDACNELERLFSIAVKEQKRLKLKLFSDDYDIKSL